MMSTLVRGFSNENSQVLPAFPLVSLGKARHDAPHSVIAKFNRNVEFNMATPLKAVRGLAGINL